ncbi:MarR family transcriptional regulator [Kitasatospora sp. MAA4]|uniref:MarR family transcriptional regulator n=1 Tax=Kitasatospora sp. MAA4 TaxID=3035093 RepID=UPI0024731856|nr:MarR family transcriptional regulator [Kitasatospora sp. MAA4]
MASPGYGKRSAPGQRRRRKRDFAQLAEREAYLARFIDELPDGAAMDTKTLAKSQPRYGQQGVGTALRTLSEGGYLRRIRENVGNGRTRWVHRTYFSRTPRDDAWWEKFLKEPPGASPTVETVEPVEPDDEPPAPSPEPVAPRQYEVLRSKGYGPYRPPAPPRSDAYEALSSLALVDSRLALSARDCAELEPLAAAWLELGSTVHQLHAALTAGLPPEVHSPGGFARRRLVDKLPPAPPLPSPAPQPVDDQPPPRRIMECTECRVPGRPESLPGGLCRTCKGDPLPATFAREPLVDVQAHVAHLRNLIRRQ